MTKTDLARQLLTLIKNEELIDSFEIKEDSISIAVHDDKSLTKTISLNLDIPLSEEPSIIRDFTISKSTFDPLTNEAYHDVSLKFFLLPMDTLNSNIINEYYLVGKQFVENFKESVGKQFVEKFKESRNKE